MQPPGMIMNYWIGMLKKLRGESKSELFLVKNRSRTTITDKKKYFKRDGQNI